MSELLVFMKSIGSTTTAPAAAFAAPIHVGAETACTVLSGAPYAVRDTRVAAAVAGPA